MGRKGVSVQAHQKWAFNRLAPGYDGRPAYPEDLVDQLEELSACGPIADLGAGTGHLALPLAQRGLQVTAVEPAVEMLNRLRTADPQGRIACVHAAAEETGLPSASQALVILADALHWVDPGLAGIEIGRVLAPLGTLAILEVEPGDHGFTRGLVALSEAHNPRRRRVKTHDARSQLFRLACGAAPVGRVEWLQRTALDEAALIKLLGTWTHLTADARPFDAFAADARALAREQGGAVWERRLVLFFARRVDTGRPPRL